LIVTPGSGNKQGTFELSWPGHPVEMVRSMYRNAEYITAEAKEFIDAWIEDGYVVLPVAQEEK